MENQHASKVIFEYKYANFNSYAKLRENISNINPGLVTNQLSTGFGTLWA